MSGFSSRSYASTVTQLPQRDEALMYDMKPGFSNSKATKDAPAEAESVEEKVLDADSDKVEDKAVTPKRTTRKKS